MANANGIRAEYLTFGDSIRGYLARPEGAGSFPTVVLLHERYGLFQHTLDLAEKFAREGYLCLAPDLYSRVRDQTDLLAGKVSIPVPDPQVRADLDTALAYAQDLPAVDETRLAVMGVCMTGRYPLVVGAYRDDLAALVVVYGGAANKEWQVTEFYPEPLATLVHRLSAPVLGIFGERDHVIPVPDVLRLRNHLEQANNDFDISIYPNMPHGWLNDRMPGRYREKEAEVAWRQILGFLGRAFRGEFMAERVQWRFESNISRDYDPSKNVRLE